MATTEKTRGVDLISQTYARIRDLIASGRLAPGTRIIESDLARRLSVSRTPIRSALGRLQQERWVSVSETGRNLRLSVSPTTKTDARELSQIVGAVEGLAARWAAALPVEERGVLVSELRALNEEFRVEAARPAPDADRFFALHAAYHGRLVSGTHAPRLETMHQAIKPQADRYRRVYGTALVTSAGDVTAENEALAAAILSGDPAAAEARARYNWEQASQRMSDIIDQWGEKGSW
jgi:DNA-binding GntR family transcriptional regulator